MTFVYEFYTFRRFVSSAFVLKIGHNAMRKNKNIKHYIIRDAGHNTHLENPKSFIDIKEVNTV